MSDIRDFSGKNRKFTGTGGIKVPSGTQAQRVNEAGTFRFNTDTNLAEYYDGTDWKPIDAPPTITGFTVDGGSSVTTFEIDNEAVGDATIVISGSNFDITSGTVVFEAESGGSNVSVQTITRTNSSSFTVTVTRTDFLTANDPYSIKLTNGSGLAATLASAITADESAPVFNEAAGNLGTAYNTESATFDGGATDEDNDTITYSISAGALPSGLSINSSTGSITGTPSGNTAGDFTFTVSAATATLTSTRQFVITIADLPTGGSITSSGGYRIHTFTSSGTFTNTVSNLSVEYLVVAGGGSGGIQHSGGGGAGGFRTNVSGATSGGGASAESSLSLATGSYTVTVGGGGAKNTNLGNSNGTRGNNGSDTTINFPTAITSIGGGRGGRYDSVSGDDGGSGGGAPTDAGSPGAGTANQGFAGGATGGSHGATGGGGGGGGGAGSAGVGGNGSTGDGGIGVQSSIDGTTYYYAGGGGGARVINTGLNGSRSGNGGNGGGGGGGDGSNSGAVGGTGGSGRTSGGNGGASNGVDANCTGGDGGANTGGGGGASGRFQAFAGSGGSGIAIIRYPI